MADPGQVFHPNSNQTTVSDDQQDQPQSDPAANPPAAPPAPPSPPLPEPAPPDPAVSPPPAPSPVPTDPQDLPAGRQDPHPEPVDDPDQPNPEELEERNQKSPAAPPVNNNSAVSPSATLFEWQASEYVDHHHSAGWFVGLGLVTLALLVFMILILKEWLSGVVVVLMMIAVVVYARRPARVLNYGLTESGVQIGDKFHSYNEFRGFALVPHGGLPTVELDPLRRFMPRLSIFFDPKDEDKILEILEPRLPRNDRAPDAVDRLSQYLKF